MLGTGKEMLLAAVRVLKAADVFDCLRVIKKLRLALQTVDVFGNQVTRPSEFSELAGLVVGDCEAACKGFFFFFFLSNRQTQGLFKIFKMGS